MQAPRTDWRLKGKDLITVGIFSAVYFVINFAFMLFSGFHPILWILMPGLIALFTGIPYMLMAVKVQKPGAVLLMGLITALIYLATGQLTVLIVISFILASILAELVRYIAKYKNAKGTLISFMIFSLGMIGSPVALWIFKDSFFAQITEQGMPADYVSTLQALTSTPMLFVMIVAPVIGAILGGLVARSMFRKHFTKAGIA